MISFENTEIAFSGKSNRELKMAYRLFKLVGNKITVKIGKQLTIIALKLRLPVKGLIKKTIFKQFCGGVDINECEATVAQLAKYNIGTILDYSVEGKESEADFDIACKEIIATAHNANKNDNIPFCVFKPSGIARLDLLAKVSGKSELTDTEKEEYRNVCDRVDQICKNAYEANTPVFIDAEESWMQDAIDDLADAMMAKYNKEKAIVYNTAQMYRWDKLEFLKASHAKAKAGNYWFGIKMVRGAYMEKERERAEELKYKSPIQPDKASADKDYNSGLEFCMENIDQIALCAGTHNEQSSLYLTELMEKHNIEKNDKRVYFAQLLGMSDHISFNLSNAGYNVAKYVPYGPIKEVLPYLIRRAEENTSVAGQTSRELTLIMKERKRRKGKK
jgi:proline dehydrogenase